MSINNMQDRVLALKYRPTRFEDLIGQTTISQTLSLALDSKRLSHAYLFSGLRGSGKTSTARIMAKALLCENGPTSRPCEVCEHCLSANSSRHLDIIEMDAASNRGIDDIKDLIEHTKYKPSSARYKVFIIDEVHMLTTQAFNALLKTLEEPPAFVKFILATTDALKLPATILSRTQHFRFNKIPQNEVIAHLSSILNKEGIEFEANALNILARSGHGSLRDTLTLLDQAIIFSKGRVETSSVVDMLGLIEPSLMDKIFNIIFNKDDLNPLLHELQNYETSQIFDEITIYLKDKMLKKDIRFDTILYERFFRILSEAKFLLSLNSDDNFVLILTFMKLVEATNLKTIDEIIEQVQNIEPKIENNYSKIETPILESSKNIELQIEIKQDFIHDDIDKGADSYEKLIEKVFDRSIELGECFERNFIYNGFSNNILNIISYAQDEDRKFLYKHFPIIKTLAQDIFGSDIEINFKKEEATILNDNNIGVENNLKIESEHEDLNTNYNKKEEVNEYNDFINNSLDGNAGCVADSLKSKNESLSEKELQAHDILNSKMVNKAKELFDIAKITVKSRS